MAKVTHLASTLIARYYPSKTLTDAFYMDGRLFGKREIRNADITIDKEERGFFFSVFSHPTIPGYEPGTVPPYEPQLRAICNEVKFGRKTIDEMISGFLTTAVDITGKMKLQDEENRAPYFSGVIVRDSEAFAVTIGSGLAFLYRNDTLYPLTDAGIPMEPIDASGNRVGDFYNYVSSKTANALWSNITSLAMDDCIILCNKSVYDALGQRELLRILDEAEDQCDAAGTVITQAAANMPNAPMQFTISFVENVTADEKKGFFKFRKKDKEQDNSNMSIKSSFDEGVIGAAAEAVANAGFAPVPNVSNYDSNAGINSDITFGTSEPVGTAGVAGVTAASGVSAPAGVVGTVGAAAAADVVGMTAGAVDVTADAAVNAADSIVESTLGLEFEFGDDSVNSNTTSAETSAEDMMRALFDDLKTSGEKGQKIQSEAEQVVLDSKSTPVEENIGINAETVVEGVSFAPEQSEIPEDSPFVSSFNPFAVNEEVTEQPMEKISETLFETDSDDDMLDTKTVNSFDSLFAQQYSNESGISKDGIIAAALRELKEENAESLSKNLELNVDNSDASQIVSEETAMTGTTLENSVDASTEPVSEESSSVVNPVEVKNDEITFSVGSVVENFDSSSIDSKPFAPYDAGEIDSGSGFGGLTYGDFEAVDENTVNGGVTDMSEDNHANEPSFEWQENGIPTIALEDPMPAPEYDIAPESNTINPVENVDFSFANSTAPNAAAYSEPSIVDSSDASPSNLESVNATVSGEESFVLPFEDAVYAAPEPQIQQNDVPPMPVYSSPTYDSPTYAVNSEQPVDQINNEAYSVGQYAENEDMSASYIPYQSFGNEGYINNVDTGYVNDTSYTAPQYQVPVEPYGDGTLPVADTNISDVNMLYTDSVAGNADSQTPYENTQPPYGADPAMDDLLSGIFGDDDIDLAMNQGGYSDMSNSNSNQNTQSQASSRPGSSVNGQRRTSANASGYPASGNPRVSTAANGGRGGNGGKKPFKLGRNGYIFFAMVGVLLIALIIVIALIAKSCSKDDDTKTKKSSKGEKIEETESSEPSAIVPVITSEVDPTAPIGAFKFSTYTGYRTWWDLFKKIYEIEIDGPSDPRVAIICQYNNAPEGYKPNAEDVLLLPPIGVINGQIPLTSQEPSNPDTSVPSESSQNINTSLEGAPSVSS